MRRLACARRLPGTLGAMNAAPTLLALMCATALFSGCATTSEATPRQGDAPVALHMIPEAQRGYCGDFIVVCGLCVVDGPGWVFDRRTQAYLGMWIMNNEVLRCYPQDTPQAECSTLRQRFAKALAVCYPSSAS